MKKTLFCLSVGVICSAIAFAQDTTTTSQTTQSSTAADSNASSIQGCLRGSDGNYTLTQDGTSTTYKLVGMEPQLKKHVGHEVAVTGSAATNAGSASSATDQGQAQPSSSSSSSSGAASGNSLQVTNVKMVSSQCSSSANDTQSPK
jgi:hypothetical protein